jgi:hypothetical protein
VTVINEWVWSDGGIMMTRETEALGEKLLPVPHCSP